MWNRVKPYVYSILIALGVGGLSALLTGGSMDLYKTLNQPPLAPPAWVFPVVWTILYVLMGISSALVYREGGPDSKRAKSEYWWLRDPFCSSSTLYAWAVYRDGSLHNAMDCSTGKLSLPACIIPSDMLFSLTPNPDGSYSPIL